MRIGLIFSAEPSHAWAPPIRPPLRRYSSVSIANHIFRLSRARRARSATAAASAPSRAAAAAASTTSPSTAAGAGRVDHVDPLGVVAELVACLLGRPDRPRHAARQMDRNDVFAAIEDRLVDREEVADRGLRGRGQLLGRAEPPVVRVVVGDLGLALGLALPVHVQTDLLDAVLGDELGRQVVARIRDDRDRGHQRRTLQIGSAPRAEALSALHACNRCDRLHRLARHPAAGAARRRGPRDRAAGVRSRPAGRPGADDRDRRRLRPSRDPPGDARRRPRVPYRGHGPACGWTGR